MGYQDTLNCESLANQGDLSVSSYQLFDAYPNPFNPKTIIKYHLIRDSQVKVTIHDQRGRLIITLCDNRETSGTKSIQWNGKNTKGENVGSGMYFYRIQTGFFSQTKKVVLLK